MIHELWYTSAPRGLYPGSSGFCTVKASKDIPLPLRELLESLSHYRHVYPPNHQLAAKNPINYSNVTASVAGKRWNIVSRIQDAGLDHTQRSNFFAHHLAIDVASARQTSPTKLLHVFASSWDFRVEELAASRGLTHEEEPLRVCGAWQAVAGDAGWAGVVAEAISIHREVCLVFAPGAQLLPLVSEVAGLTSKGKQSELTFSTYFNSGSKVTDCKLRCVLADSEEHREATRSKGLLVNLTAPLPPAIGGELVDVARNGNRPRTAPAPPVEPSTGRLLANDAASLEGMIESPANTQLAWKNAQPATMPGPQKYPAMPAAGEPAKEPVVWLLPVCALAGVALACLLLVPLLLVTRANLSTTQAAVRNLTSENERLKQDLTTSTSELGNSKQQREALEKASAAAVEEKKKLTTDAKKAKSSEQDQRNTRLALVSTMQTMLLSIANKHLKAETSGVPPVFDQDPTTALHQTVGYIEKAISDCNFNHSEQIREKNTLIASYVSENARQAETIKRLELAAKKKANKSVPEETKDPTLPNPSRLPRPNNGALFPFERSNGEPKSVELVTSSKSLTMESRGTEHNFN